MKPGTFTQMNMFNILINVKWNLMKNSYTNSGKILFNLSEVRNHFLYLWLQKFKPYGLIWKPIYLRIIKYRLTRDIAIPKSLNCRTKVDKSGNICMVTRDDNMMGPILYLILYEPCFYLSLIHVVDSLKQNLGRFSYFKVPETEIIGAE